MLMVVFVIMVGWAGGNIILNTDTKAECYGRINHAHGCAGKAGGAAPGGSCNGSFSAGQHCFVGQVRFVDEYDVRSGHLVFEQFRQGRIVVKRWVGGALGVYRTNIPGECPGCNGRRIGKATTASTVVRLRTSGHWNACSSGFGSASPDVSMMM